MNARAIAVLATLALCALQFLWHAILAPPTGADPWLYAAFFALPILPAVVLALTGQRRAPFWGALAALLYFSHGVMEAWSAPAVRTLAWAEIALSLIVVVAGSWDGLRARFGRRRAV